MLRPNLTTRPFATFFILAVFLLGLTQTGCRESAKKIDEGVVINEKVDVLNSTALVASKIGQLKRGDAVDIYFRANVNGVDWVRVTKPGGELKTGWVEARHIVNRKVLDQCLNLAKENADIPAQIGGKLRKETRLRMQPGRDSDVVTVLKSGVTFDILKRVRLEYKPPATPQKENVKEDPDSEDNGPKYDYWYLARFPEESVFRAGWVYGGSIEIVEPDEIAGLIGSGRKTVAAIPFGGTLDKHGKMQKNYFIVDKQSTNGDNVDFDRIYVVRWDPTADNYTSAFYEMNLRGMYPILYKTESETHTLFTLSLMDKDGKPLKTDYQASLFENTWSVAKVIPGQPLPEPKSRKRK